MDASSIPTLPPGTNNFQLASQIFQNIQQTISQEIQTVQQIQQQMIQNFQQEANTIVQFVDMFGTQAVPSTDFTWIFDQNGNGIGIPPQFQSNSPPSPDPSQSGNSPGSNPVTQTNGSPIGTYIGTETPSFGSDPFVNVAQRIAVTINGDHTATVSIPGLAGGFSHTLAVSTVQNPDGSWTIQGADNSVDNFVFTVSGNQATANIEVVQNGLVEAYNGHDDPPSSFILTKQ